MVYSNFDHTFDAEEVTRLLANPDPDEDDCGQHSAWEFCGEVWFGIDGLWHEIVWRHRCVVAEYSDESLEDLIETVNDNHGRD